MKLSIKITLIIIIVLIFGLFMFGRFYAFDIVEDRPFAKAICNFQRLCKIEKESWPCIDNHNPQMIEWEGWQGCNEDTKGYVYQALAGQDASYLFVDTCNCAFLIEVH